MYNPAGKAAYMERISYPSKDNLSYLQMLSPVSWSKPRLSVFYHSTFERTLIETKTSIGSEVVTVSFVMLGPVPKVRKELYKVKKFIFLT